MNGDCALYRPFKSREAQPKRAARSSGWPAYGIDGHMMEMLKIYTKESPGFPATIGPSHVITGAAARVGDLLRALSVEASQRLGKGIQG
jgi:hypothetical protein